MFRGVEQGLGKLTAIAPVIGPGAPSDGKARGVQPRTII
jgi:hypothetical protein